MWEEICCFGHGSKLTNQADCSLVYSLPQSHELRSIIIHFKQSYQIQRNLPIFGIRSQNIPASLSSAWCVSPRALDILALRPVTIMGWFPESEYSSPWQLLSADFHVCCRIFFSCCSHKDWFHIAVGLFQGWLGHMRCCLCILGSKRGTRCIFVALQFHSERWHVGGCKVLYENAVLPACMCVWGGSSLAVELRSLMG